MVEGNKTGPAFQYQAGLILVGGSNMKGVDRRVAAERVMES